MNNLLQETEARYPVKINAYCRKLAEKSEAVRKLYYPDPRELDDAGLEADGLGECRQSPLPKLVRRYRDRGALLVTTECFSRCRFCFRKRLWAAGNKPEFISDAELQEVRLFLNKHPEVDDILLTGGDAMMLGEKRLLEVARFIRESGSVVNVRVCSRAPAVEPQVITESLAEGLAAIAGCVFMTHFNHPDELTEEARQACSRLVSHGVPVFDQTVLLAGINDDTEILRKLFKTLAAWRVKPHYLFHIDPVEGVSHFATGTARGLEIMNDFRGTLSSLATPAFCIDLPGGGGKVNLCPDCSCGMDTYYSAIFDRPVRHPLAGKPDGRAGRRNDG